MGIDTCVQSGLVNVNKLLQHLFSSNDPLVCKVQGPLKLILLQKVHKDTRYYCDNNIINDFES